MTPRILPSSILLAAALGLGACASSGEPRLNYQGELDKLTADCTARDGILAPIPGAQTGRPQTEYVCEIRGGGGRIQRN